MPSVTMVVNGKEVSGEVEGRTLLVEFLRENLGLTGTHVGCDTSQCGACVVHVDGKAVKSCTALALASDGTEVTTIEGVANGKLHPTTRRGLAAHTVVPMCDTSRSVGAR